MSELRDRAALRAYAETHKRNGDICRVYPDELLLLVAEPGDETFERVLSAARYVVAASDGTHDTMASHDHSKCLPYAMTMLKAAVASSRVPA